MPQERKPEIGLSPPRLPDRYELPQRPGVGAAAFQDAYRQSQFLLQQDIRLFEQAMRQQLAVARQLSRVREHQARAILMLCSRVYAYLEDAFSLLLTGRYASCHPLLKSGRECLAAQQALMADGFRAYRRWLDNAVRQSREVAALDFDRGEPEGTLLSENGAQGSTYRLASLLASPDFGGATLQTGPETSPQRLSLAFADTSFHLGWAELISGWSLALARDQLNLSLGCCLFQPDGEMLTDSDRLQADINAALNSPQRCHAEETSGRFLIRNFRRGPTAAPRRILL